MNRTNTTIAFIGLLLALITAIIEFWPKSDLFTVNITSHNTSKPSINAVRGNFPHWETKRPTGLIQFGHFGAQIHNISSNNISITGLRVGILNTLNEKIFDESLMADLEIFGPNNYYVPFPISIPANEAIMVGIGTTIPYDIDAGSKNECIKAGHTFSEVETCLREHGRDLAGNNFDVVTQGNIGSRKYHGDKKSIHLVFRFFAADGFYSDAIYTLVR